jgi:hypothetical protein
MWVINTPLIVDRKSAGIGDVETALKGTVKYLFKIKKDNKPVFQFAYALHVV